MSFVSGQVTTIRTWSQFKLWSIGHKKPFCVSPSTTIDIQPASLVPRPAPQAPRPAPQAPRPIPQAPQQMQRQQQNDPLLCAKGPTCINLERGNCVFGGVYYHRTPNHLRQEQQEQPVQRLQDRQCWFNENCRRIACPFSHESLTDFPNLTRPMRPQILRWNQNNARFNQ